jgi:hypothetical protein
MAQGIIKASILVEEPKEVVDKPDYNEAEQRYLSNLQKRLENAKNLREQPQPEFDDMTFEQYWQKCEDLANTKIKPKMNKQDIQFQTGTLRTKLFAFLSSLLSLNLGGEIAAYDESDIYLGTVSTGLEDIVDKADRLDEDEEKRLLRQYELLKHGYVFVEEIWDDRWIIEKQPVNNYSGEFRNVKIKTSEVKKVGRPVRNIISGLSVYLGDLRKYLISEQPYIFTATTISYNEAEQIYGHFENFKYVSKVARPFSGDSDKAMTNNSWRLMDSQADWVEVIRYADKPNQEYQIILNGVPMLPLGFPFPWGYDDYNLTQQNLKPIRHDFAYGKSFIFESKNPIQLLDEFMKLGLLKTQKSFLPPYINTSGKIISTKVLMPATISMGIPPGALVPVSPNEIQGMTNAEFNMIQQLTKIIDTNTASQTFTGNPEQGQVLATQIVELQRQAKLMMGTLIAAASLLEQKLIMLRLMNVLKNWFAPIDEMVDKARNTLRQRYRISTRQIPIEGKGMGMRMIVPTENLPTADEIKTTEDQLSKNTGQPVRIIALNPKELETAKLTWVIRVNPKEKKSSELSKLMFSSEVMAAASIGLQLSQAWKEERFAEVWEENASKMFDHTAPATAPGQPATPGVPGTPAAGAAPAIKSPQIKVPGPVQPGVIQ